MRRQSGRLIFLAAHYARVFFRHRTSLLVAGGSALAGHCKVAEAVDSLAHEAGASPSEHFGYRSCVL
jgi:hypothetical protein